METIFWALNLYTVSIESLYQNTVEYFGPILGIEIPILGIEIQWILYRDSIPKIFWGAYQ